MKRWALITGAAGGIGRATTELFAAEGWETIAVDRREAGSYPAGVTFRRADVAIPDDVEALFTWLAKQTDRLDALVNNAAVQICKPMVAMTVDEWDSVMASNLRSAFMTARAGYRLLKAASGAIVNVSSVHAVATSRDIAAYAASKGGLVALTRATALELAPDSIRANVVLPGAVDTPMLHAGLSRDHVAGDSLEERMAHLGRRTVMGRVGQPAEIAQAILYLADNDRSSFVTGQALVIDGGATARLSTE
jgi:glucose 1-dehydrogenase